MYLSCIHHARENGKCIVSSQSVWGLLHLGTIIFVGRVLSIYVHVLIHTHTHTHTQHTHTHTHTHHVIYCSNFSTNAEMLFK